MVAEKSGCLSGVCASPEQVCRCMQAPCFCFWVASVCVLGGDKPTGTGHYQVLLQAPTPSGLSAFHIAPFLPGGSRLLEVMCPAQG